MTWVDRKIKKEGEGEHEKKEAMAEHTCTAGSLGHAFLLTEKGNVEAVKIAEGLCVDTLCSTGPLYGLPAIENMEPGTRENGDPTVFAADGNGTQYDLTEYIRSWD